MSASYTDNTSAIKSLVQQRASIFLRFMCDEMIVSSTPNTPKDTGRMRMDINKQVLGLNGKVKWGKNYAKYQETKRFQNYTTAGTGPHFAEDAARDIISRTGNVARKAGLI